MLRKIGFTILLFLLCVSVVACGAADVIGDVSSETDASYGAEESSGNNVIELSDIELPDESSRPSEHSKPDISDTGTDQKPQTSWPKLTCSNPYIVTPQIADNDELPIRSIKNVPRGSVQLFGRLDKSNEQVASALSEIDVWLSSYDKNIGFFAYALDGTAAVAYNCEDSFFSACTIKAAYMLYCCLAVDQGLADRNTVMYYQECYYHGGSGDIRLTEYGTPYTIETLIYKALNISDNVAYEMLTAYFGYKGFNQFVNDLGCPSLNISRLWCYKMNAKDLCVIWREIYFYFQTETTMAKLYKKACTNTKFNYCALYLGESYSHKSGDNFGEKWPAYNDGAIIWADRPYVVAFLTRSEGTSKDEKTVNTISKIIYDRLMKPIYPPKVDPKEEL